MVTNRQRRQMRRQREARHDNYYIADPDAGHMAPGARDDACLVPSPYAKQKHKDGRNDDDDDVGEPKGMSLTKALSTLENMCASLMMRMDEFEARSRKDDDDPPMGSEDYKHEVRGKPLHRKDSTVSTRDDITRMNIQAKRIQQLEAELYAERRRQDALQRRISPLSIEEHNERSKIVARLDSAYSTFGERAPAPYELERPRAYQARALNALKRKCADPELRGAQFDEDMGETLDFFEENVRKDSVAAQESGYGVPRGTLREVRKRLSDGGTMIEFQGKDTFVKQMTAPHIRQARIFDQRDIQLQSAVARAYMGRGNNS